MNEIEFQTLIGEVFYDSEAPTSFMSSMFRDHEPTDSYQLVVDEVAGNRRMAVDNVPDTKAAQDREQKPYVSKVYQFPSYDEATNISADRFKQRLVGQSQFDPINRSVATAGMIVAAQLDNRDAILRANEYIATQAILTGHVPLVNSESVNFGRKSSHNIIVNKAWTDPTATPYADIEKAARFNKIDGMSTSNLLIFGNDAWTAFTNSKEFKEKATFVNVKFDDITTPVPSAATSGAVFHGIITVGSYRYQCWTYPQVYEVPQGYGLSGEGTVKPYIPSDMVIVMEAGIRMDRYWGSHYRFFHGNAMGSMVAGTSIALQSQPVRFLNYYETLGDTSIRVGVRARPMHVIPSINKISVISTKVNA